MRLVVEDTGSGIAPEFLPHVFERFRQASSGFSRKHGGLGLGLAICRDLVGLHGGTVAVESAGPGRGAIFSVELPALNASEDRTAAAAAGSRGYGQTGSPARSVSLHGVRVLVVDDEPDALTLLRESLEAAGATVTCAMSTGEACRAIDVGAPDVLITDLGMPDADGFELIRRVRTGQPRFRNLPAAALTAYARSEDRVRTLSEGFQLHLSKPIDPRELVAAVASLATGGHV